MNNYMKTYKVVLFKESFLSAILGAGNVDVIKFSELLNKNAAEGWKVVTMEKDIQRVLLFFRREAFLVIMEK
jgi:hypothetical protein